MRKIKFRYWTGEEMIDGDSLAFEEYAPLTHLLSTEGIMQYTEVQDMCGVEIYEEDICLALISGLEFIVKFKDGCFYPSFIHEEDDYCECLCLKDISKVLVIGNVYENPELVKGRL